MRLDKEKVDCDFLRIEIRKAGIGGIVGAPYRNCTKPGAPNYGHLFSSKRCQSCPYNNF